MQNSPLPSAGIRHPIGMIQIKWQFAEEIFFLKRMRDGWREEKLRDLLGSRNVMEPRGKAQLSTRMPMPFIDFS